MKQDRKKMTHIIFSTNLTMSPQIDDFLKKAPFLNLSSYCSGSVSVTIRIIKQKTQSDKPVGLTWLWSSVGCFAHILMSFNRNCLRAVKVQAPPWCLPLPIDNYLFPFFLYEFSYVLSVRCNNEQNQDKTEFATK